MPNWADQVTAKFVRNVANTYVRETGLAAFKIFPNIPTGALSGNVAKYDKTDFLRIGTVSDYVIKGAVETPGDDYSVAKEAYTLTKYGFHKDITEDERNEYDNPFEPVRDAVTFTINRIRRVLLTKLVSAYMSSGVWGTDTNLTSVKWDAKTDGVSDNDPIEKVLILKDNIRKATGYSPNRLIMAPDVFRALKRNTFITGSMKTTSDQVVNKNLIASLFEVDTLEILDDVNEAGTNYMIAGKALLAFTPDSPTKYEPSAGYWLTYKESNNNLIGSRRIWMPHLNNALRVENYLHAHPMVLASDLGNYLYNIVS